MHNIAILLIKAFALEIVSWKNSSFHRGIIITVLCFEGVRLLPASFNRGGRVLLGTGTVRNLSVPLVARL